MTLKTNNSTSAVQLCWGKTVNMNPSLLSWCYIKKGSLVARLGGDNTFPPSPPFSLRPKWSFKRLQRSQSRFAKWTKGCLQQSGLLAMQVKQHCIRCQHTILKAGSTKCELSLASKAPRLDSLSFATFGSTKSRTGACCIPGHSILPADSGGGSASQPHGYKAVLSSQAPSGLAIKWAHLKTTQDSQKLPVKSQTDLDEEMAEVIFHFPPALFTHHDGWGCTVQKPALSPSRVETTHARTLCGRYKHIPAIPRLRTRGQAGLWAGAPGRAGSAGALAALPARSCRRGGGGTKLAALPGPPRDRRSRLKAPARLRAAPPRQRRHGPAVPFQAPPSAGGPAGTAGPPGGESRAPAPPAGTAAGPPGAAAAAAAPLRGGAAAGNPRQFRPRNSGSMSGGAGRGAAPGPARPPLPPFGFSLFSRKENTGGHRGRAPPPFPSHPSLPFPRIPALPPPPPPFARIASRAEPRARAGHTRGGGGRARPRGAAAAARSGPGPAAPPLPDPPPARNHPGTAAPAPGRHFPLRGRAGFGPRRRAGRGAESGESPRTSRLRARACPAGLRRVPAERCPRFLLSVASR